MQRHVCLMILAFASLAASPAWAQFKEGGQEEDGKKGTTRGEAEVQRWQFGLTLSADNGSCSGLLGYVPVPLSWPEQEVSIVQEDITPLAKIRYETIEGGKLMLMDVPRLPAGEQAKVLVTCEIRKHAQLPPEKTDIYEFPDARKLPRDVKPYLNPSPMIEVKNARIKAALREAIEGKDKAWDKVEAIYDWVRNKVQYKKGPVKGALAVLRDGSGSDEDSTSLFIAMCRTANVPARTVWVPGHCYAEFYLEDDEGKGHWFPCELTGNRAFGGISDPRPVIQKGDNFRPPYNRHERQRFMGEYLTGTGGTPKKKFVRQAAP